MEVTVEISKTELSQLGINKDKLFSRVAEALDTIEKVADLAPHVNIVLTD